MHVMKVISATRLRRRAWLASPTLLLLPGLPVLARASSTDSADSNDVVRRGRRLVFPRDHGAHPAQRIEWWYVTGWLAPPQTPDDATHGFQVTFFRIRTRLGEGMKSRFAPRQLLVAQAAITDLRAQRHHHAQRIARWSGDDDVDRRDHARLDDAGLRVGTWGLDRRDESTSSTWLTTIDAGEWSLDARLRATQPLLLQGDNGYSVKVQRAGAESTSSASPTSPTSPTSPDHASHYVTDPQLAAAVRLRLDGRALELQGRAWLDHEWSDNLLPDNAVGWDWFGMNLDDGSTLTAARVRASDGSVLSAGAGIRDARGASRLFMQGVHFTPSRIWTSPATGGRYPMAWIIDTPVGRFEVRSLLDAQELDTRTSLGTVYWEGVSSLHDERGQRIGRGYLEMTGYVGRVRV